MKQLLLIALVTIIPFAGYSQTQSGMNDDASIAYRKSDQNLNNTYKKILQVYANNTEFISRLRAAQRLWVQFRDAQLEMKYPSSGNYGSMVSMCASYYLAELTDKRTAELREWLQQLPDGEACGGSIGETNNN